MCLELSFWTSLPHKIGVFQPRSRNDVQETPNALYNREQGCCRGAHPHLRQQLTDQQRRHRAGVIDRQRPQPAGAAVAERPPQARARRLGRQDLSRGRAGPFSGRPLFSIYLRHHQPGLDNRGRCSHFPAGHALETIHTN